MDEQNTQVLTASAEKLASAAEALERAIARIAAQQNALHSKVDRIVAALEDGERLQASQQTGLRATGAEHENAGLKAGCERKTLSPLVSMLLNKHGIGEHPADGSALDKALRPLSLEQRIAVKAEMARAGFIE